MGVTPPGGTGDPEVCRIDDRQVAYETAGDPTGRPVLFCHGTPGSRLLVRLLGAPAADRGLRLVAPDRPGIGASDPVDGGIETWTDDVRALFAHLGVDGAEVLGFSGGAPYALACHRLSAVDRVTLAGGVGPPAVGDVARTQRVLGHVAGTVPWVLGPLLRLQRLVLDRRDPAAALDFVAKRAPGHPTLTDADVARLVKADLLAATAQGPATLVESLATLGRPWPFDLGDVDVPVTVVQGRRDGNVSPETGPALVEQIPDATHRPVDADHLGSLLASVEYLRASPTHV
ncbi:MULTISPECIES: alpha/beta fold hydrolase [Haloarcula]|uniref:alpha/beta fold hydrolase n=1 Tax=Haloarcula TaxID=2237 RepID=UPI0023EDD589|nr:alpha/beta hydrolase [Halomicroarcula sp. XH51]